VFCGAFPVQKHRVLSQGEPSKSDAAFWGGHPKVLAAIEAIAFAGCPRRSLRCLGFLSGLCGVADHVQHTLWLGEHWDVTGAQLKGCGAHALCNKALQFGLYGAIFSGHDVPTRVRPPSDTVGLLLEQVGHRCSLGRPQKLPLCFGQITRETFDTRGRDR
jgi:hypothetical protein